MKCAGTSVEAALLEQVSGNAICAGSKTGEMVDYPPRNNVDLSIGVLKKYEQHTYPEMFWKQKDTSRYKDYLALSICRNPWDMLVSYYWHGMVGAKLDHSVLGGDPELYNRCQIFETDSPDIIKEKFEFSMTLASSYNQDEMGISVGLKSQIASPLIYFSLINSRFCDNSIRRYLRYENLSNDYRELCSDLNLKHSPLQKYKSSARKLRLHYSEYFSTWMRDEISYYFSDYIEKFNYEFEG